MLGKVISTLENNVSGEFSNHNNSYTFEQNASKSSIHNLKIKAKVLFITSEIGDYVKVGGLGEVSAALPRALKSDCDVRVLIPGYREIREKNPQIYVVKSMPRTSDLPPWSLGKIYTHDNLCIYVVLCDELYDRDGGPYGDLTGRDFADNDIRFARLSLAAAEIASGEADSNWKPDVVHANDWPSALSLGYIKWKGLETPSILTVHNLAYQGLFDPYRSSALAIPGHAFSVDGIEFHGKLSFLKSGIFYASHVTTVSETYAKEITTHQFGCGLDGLLKQRMAEGRLTGIINGIDESWLTTPELISDAEHTHWKFKKDAAQDVRNNFGLAASRGPIFAIVSRLVHQKGIDLSIKATKTIVENGGQLVVTGKGEQKIEEAVSKLSKLYPGQVGVKIGFEDKDAKSMFTGSDFLLMPSRFEPCGLSQMYAQTQGALPIAHETGGLADTIEDGRSGFLFQRLSPQGLAFAINRALGAFSSKKALAKMRRNACLNNIVGHYQLSIIKIYTQKQCQYERGMKKPTSNFIKLDVDFMFI